MADWGSNNIGGGLTSGSSSGFMGNLLSQFSNDPYKQYMDQAMANSQTHENQGRNDLQQYFEMSQGYGDPYRQAGNSALQSWMGSMGLGGAGQRQSALESFKASPSYQFSLNQGLGAAQKNMAAAGGRGSGAEKKALTQYATNLANTEYGQWQQGLAGLTGIGANASEQAANRAYGTGNNLAQLGLGYSGQQTQLTSDIAQATAEKQAADAQAKAQNNSSEWGAFGDIAGGLFGLFS